MRCDICAFEASSTQQLAGHRSGHVRRGELKKRTERTWPTGKCKICMQVFKSCHALGAHMRSHWTLERLISASPYGSSKNTKFLRKLLLAAGHKYDCTICGIGPTWNGLSLTLQIDHIDGDHQNHNLENLRFLCPNCHTQTQTYGRKIRFNV